MHKLYVPRVPSTSGREQLLADLKPPMIDPPSDAIEADLDRLVVTFVFGAEGGDLAPTTTIWADMRVVPMVGDAVRLRAIGVAREGFAIVRSRIWLEANWMTLQVTELGSGVNGEIDEGDDLTPEQMAARYAEESRLADVATST